MCAAQEDQLEIESENANSGTYTAVGAGLAFFLFMRHPFNPDSIDAGIDSYSDSDSESESNSESESDSNSDSVPFSGRTAIMAQNCATGSDFLDFGTIAESYRHDS